MSFVQLLVICGVALPGLTGLLPYRVVSWNARGEEGPITGGAQASFRDTDGRESMADLALVRVEQLVAGRRWRVFRWWQGQAGTAPAGITQRMTRPSGR